MKVGYVALVGRPNSGKSSFLNALIDEKVGIVSDRPQTTRKSVRGIYTDDVRQIVFFDTPGIHESKEDFNVRINSVAIRAIADADAVVRFVDSSRPYGAEESKIDELVENSRKPSIRIYSKWDVAIAGTDPAGCLTISCKDREGFKPLLDAVTELLPEGTPYYDEDYYTDQDPYTRVSEIVREKAFRLLSEEIPHDLYVAVEEFEDSPSLLKILAYVVVERDSQKRIVIGKGGEIIRQIGTEARIDLERIYGRKVHLVLRVKADPHWKKNRKLVESLLR